MSDECFRPSPSLVRALSGSPIRVGTQNPAKLGAVERALRPFAEELAELRVVPVEVASGVAEQPLGWGEIMTGARNRARAAFESGDCALAVGIEDGLVRISGCETMESGGSRAGLRVDETLNVGCAWLYDGEREGHAFSSAFAYPSECLEPAIRDRAPIGDLFDELWRSRREGPGGPANAAASGRKGGNIGRLTAGRLERSDYGAQAIVCALVRFLHTDLYDQVSAPGDVP